MFNQLLSVGYDSGTAGSIANTPNWDQTNKRFRSAMSNPPGKQSAPPAAPKAPDPIQPAPAPQKLGDGGNRLKINKKSKRRRSQLSGGITQQRINLNTSSFGGNTGGVGSVGGGA